MIKTKLAHVALTIALLATATAANAASAWPANSTPTSNVAAGLTAYNNISIYPTWKDDGFEASGAAYLSGYGYITNGDDGDLAVLSTTGSVLHYWFPTGDLEDVAITNTTSTDNLIYLANEATTAIDQFNLSTGTKTGLTWPLSGLTTNSTTGDGLEAMAYVPAAYAPAAWGTAQSGGFFLAASQAEARIYVYNINTSSSSTVTPVTSFAVTYTNVSALHYNATTQLLYVVFDSDDKIKEYSLTGAIMNSFMLPAAGSTEGVVVIPNCSTGKAQIGLTNDAVTSTLNVYDNYPITCPAAPVTTVDADSDGVISTLDCNDSDATISANRTYYRDADGDGLGLSSSTTSVCSLTAPTGYVSNSTDLNDTDYDNDGVSTVSDCNDSNSAISANQTYYRDADGDGLGTAATTSVVCSYNVTSGYVTNSSDLNDSDYDNDGVSTTSDCNDADSTISVNQTYYRDADADGLGTAAVTSVICSYTVPTGYVTNSSDLNDSDYDNDGVSTSADCNDQNSTVSALLTVYQDFDGDGLGNPAVSTTVCALTAPTGYVTNNLDTDDSGVVTPTCSKVEYLNNTVDDDCDGLVNEWNTLSSNGIHPIYGSYNASSTTLYKATVTSIAGSTNGAIKVKFADGSGYRYQVFSTSTKNSTTVKSYNGTAYLLVTANHGRNSALVNAYTGAITDSAHIASVPTKIKVLLATLTLKIKK